MKITLPDKSTIELEHPISLGDLATRLSRSLGKKAVAGKVDGQVRDLSYTLSTDAAVQILTPEDQDGLEVMRHSASHVMAEALCTLFPGTKFAYGPPIKDGFFYDVDPSQTITEEDLPRIEDEMKRIVKENRAFTRREVNREQALQEMAQDEYKTDNILHTDASVISFYRQGEGFEDLCMGPHVPSTGKIGAFKIMGLSGAYWHGDPSKKQLTRIYGTTWPNQELLKQHLDRLEEAKKRDHRQLNRVLDVYSISDKTGAGLILWHPNGGVIRHEIETFWREEHFRRGYQILYTPHIASEEIYKVSGHLENYSDSMYSPMDIDGSPYRVKPMNCPGHIMIYQSRQRSYRDLPLRWCELGTVYRYEPSGTLHGMLRVRGFTQDDSHIFCTQQQLSDEIIGVLDLVDFLMTTFGYTYKTFLATRPAKSLGTDQEWEWSTNALLKAIHTRGMAYEVDEGGGVFYAPKIDIKLVDALGREWQGPTVQVDLNLPKRFNVIYIAPDNTRQEVVMVHRTVLGSMERFVGGLIEHYGGDFPLWLSPEQLRIANITERQQAYAQELVEMFKQAGLRVTADVSNEKIGYKVREAIVAHVPYVAVIGDNEVDSRTISLRHRKLGDLGTLSVDECLNYLKTELATKALPRHWAKKED